MCQIKEDTNSTQVCCHKGNSEDKKKFTIGVLTMIVSPYTLNPSSLL